jgi:hypothetical protein
MIDVPLSSLELEILSRALVVLEAYSMAILLGA